MDGGCLSGRFLDTRVVTNPTKISDQSSIKLGRPGLKNEASNNTPRGGDCCWFSVGGADVAESEGFEPPIALRLCLISSQVHSTGLCQLSCTFSLLDYGACEKRR